MKQTRKIFKYNFSKAQLSDVPREKLKLLLVCASILNELNFSTRLVFFAANRSSHAEHETEARNAQALYLIKQLAGKIWEAHEAIKKCLLQQPTCREVSMQLEGRYLDAFNKMNQEFGKKTIYEEIRRTLAYHLDGEALLTGFHDLKDETILSAVIGPTNLNSMFTFSEDASSNRLLNIANTQTTPKHNLDDLATKVLGTAHLLDLVAEGVATAILRQHSPKLLNQRNSIEIEIDGCPEIHEVSLPFFLRVRHGQET